MYPQHIELNYMKLPSFPDFSAACEHRWLSDLISTLHSPLKEPGLLGEIDDFRAGAENVQDESGTCCYARE